MHQSAKNHVQHMIQLGADILNQETQHEVTVFLQLSILASVAAVGVFVGEMLTTVQFNHQSSLLVQQIDFHS